MNLPTCLPDATVLNQADALGLSRPIQVVVNGAEARRKPKSIRCRVNSRILPEGSFINVSDKIVVSSPELCFLQLARDLSLVKLIELGFEFCGTYSMYDANDPIKNQVDQGFYTRSKLTTTKKLRAYVDQASAFHSCRKAAYAIDFITDDSASPMETILVMLLTLPYRIGGYKIKMPELNKRVVPKKTAQPGAGNAYYKCDLYWPDAGLAVEYDSDQYHSQVERIASDSRRRNSLLATGVDVVTVTNEQIKNYFDFRTIARQIAGKLGKRLQYMEPGFSTANRKLRKLLLG
ncbi:MAG: hypothetical protein LBU61_01225 [Coriobacteriales bacterium]|nr:hypothetical protein [Coriobacteriales bacterium]